MKTEYHARQFCSAYTRPIFSSRRRVLDEDRGAFGTLTTGQVDNLNHLHATSGCLGSIERYVRQLRIFGRA